MFDNPINPTHQHLRFVIDIMLFVTLSLGTLRLLKIL